MCIVDLTYGCYMSMALMTALLNRLRCFLTLFGGRRGSRGCVCGVDTPTGVFVLLSKRQTDHLVLGLIKICWEGLILALEYYKYTYDPQEFKKSARMT